MTAPAEFLLHKMPRSSPGCLASYTRQHVLPFASLIEQRMQSQRGPAQRCWTETRGTRYVNKSAERGSTRSTSMALSAGIFKQPLSMRQGPRGSRLRHNDDTCWLTMHLSHLLQAVHSSRACSWCTRTDHSSPLGRMRSACGETEGRNTSARKGDSKGMLSCVGCLPAYPHPCSLMSSPWHGSEYQPV